MGVEQSGAARRQAINVWGLGQRMATEGADPVVLIVDRDEDDVGLLSCCTGFGQGCSERKEGQEEEVALDNRVGSQG